VYVLGHLSIPRLEVEQDIGRVTELQRQAIPTLYGDAANSDILSQVHLKQARAVIVTLPDEAAAAIVVATARAEAPHVPILVRASTKEGVHQLFALGAQHVIYPELEGGLEMIRETLDHLGYLESDVQEYTNAVRRSHYDLTNSTDVEQRAWSRCWVQKSRTNWPPLTDLEKRLTPVRILSSTSALTQLRFM
jgi:CPA2 family monovalent cation:H+ antiporter-2